MEKLDIFEVIRNINSKNYLFYDSLEEHRRGLFVPFLVYQWMSSSTDPLQVVLLNQLVNVYKLSAHPGLIYRLMCIAAGKSRYNWIYKKNTVDRDKVVSEYLKCSIREASLHSDFFSKDDIIEMMSALGYQSEEIRKLKIS